METLNHCNQKPTETWGSKDNIIQDNNGIETSKFLVFGNASIFNGITFFFSHILSFLGDGFEF